VIQGARWQRSEKRVQNTIAELDWSADGRRYRYRAREGDPLDLADLFGRLRASGKLTRAASPPTPISSRHLVGTLSRCCRAHSRLGHRGVRNASDIMVSFRPGYFYGNGSFNYLVTLAVRMADGTKRDTGFAMATFPLPAAVRVGDVIPARLPRFSFRTQNGE